MFRQIIASDWGSKPHNTHAIELPVVVKNFEYFLVTFDARHYREPLSWKLQDASGFQRHLPFFCSRKEFEKLSITVDCAGGFSYKYECTLQAWPKELQMPIARFRSISTVKISPQEKCSTLPMGRHRRKGAKNWTIGSVIIFDMLNITYESQLYYKLDNGIIIESPILEVECMWQQFDIEKETIVNMEEMMLRKNFAISINEDSIDKTDYTTSLKLISPTDHEEFNCEISLQSSSQKIQDLSVPIILGARYEFKLHVENFGKSFTRVIEVPPAGVDKKFWTTLFGEVDLVTFYKRQSKTATRWIDWYAGDGEDYDSDIEEVYLILYNHGAYSYKRTFQSDEHSNIQEKTHFGGSFTLTASTDNHIRINLLKLFAKNAKEGKVLPAPSVANFFDVGSQADFPAPLQLPELLNYIIGYFPEDLSRMECRLVCKTWCKSIRPTTSGLITNAKIFGIFNHELDIKS